MENSLEEVRWSGKHLSSRVEKDETWTLSLYLVLKTVTLETPASMIPWNCEQRPHMGAT